MRAGMRAYASGDYRLAHDLWRQSAALRPHNEQVWLALLSVVNNDEDRRACLENIVYINPENVQAMQQLQMIEARHTRTVPRLQVSRFTLRLLRALRNVIRVIITLLILLLLFVLGVIAGISAQFIRL